MIRNRLLSTVVSAIAMAAIVGPGFAAAADVQVMTQVLIPQGNAGCQAPVISGVTPYVYGNNLNSFDVNVSDPSYVSVVGSAGNTGIPLAFMTRRINPDGSLRIHVDLPDTPVGSSIQVSLTMLSSPPGQPTCITIVSFPVQGTGAPSTGNTGATSGTHTSTGGGTVKTPVTTPSSNTTATSTSSSSTAATSAPPIVGGGVQNALSRLCTAAGPYQLWFILLALFMVGVGLVAFAEPPLARKSMELPAALILVPLIVLLLFWYVTPACRVAVWIPIVLLVAAAVALIAAYREKAPVGKIMQLPPANSQPQPAAAKASVPMKQTQTTTIITPTKQTQVTTTITPQKVEQTKTIITPAPKDPSQPLQQQKPAQQPPQKK